MHDYHSTEKSFPISHSEWEFFGTLISRGRKLLIKILIYLLVGGRIKEIENMKTNKEEPK